MLDPVSKEHQPKGNKMTGYPNDYSDTDTESQEARDERFARWAEQQAERDDDGLGEDW